MEKNETSACGLTKYKRNSICKVSEDRKTIVTKHNSLHTVEV